MTRLITDGFEIGAIDSVRYPLSSGAIESTTKRTGAYSVRTYGDGFGAKTYLYCSLDEAVSEIYIRLCYYTTSANSAVYVSLRNGTTELVTLKKDSGGAGISLYIGSSEVVDSGVLVTADVWNLLEIHAKIDNSAGVVEVKLNGQQIISYSGDTQPGADTDINYIAFGNNAYYSGGSGTETLYWDDFAVNDTNGAIDNAWCGDGRIVAIKPNASGDINQLTPTSGSPINNYTMVDDIPTDGDTTYVESGTPGEYDLYNLEACGIDGSLYSISRIWVSLSAKDTTSGSGIVAPLIKTSGSEVDCNNIELLTIYQYLSSDEMLANPVTGNPWTPAEIDALQAGVKVVQ